MSRVERLYGIAERLRAAAPRLVTVATLAAEHGVSRRTVQRDLQVLMSSGVPVRFEEGRGGGWTVDPAMTLPPVNLTSEEAAALLLAAAAARHHAPLGGAADRAVAKVLAAVSAGSARSAAEWGRRLHVATDPPARAPGIGDGGDGDDGDAVRTAERALVRSRALELHYLDGAGTASVRVVEPVGLLTSGGRWYLVAWCRTRDAARGSGSTGSPPPGCSTSRWRPETWPRSWSTTAGRGTTAGRALPDPAELHDHAQKVATRTKSASCTPLDERCDHRIRCADPPDEGQCHPRSRPHHGGYE